MKNNKQKVLFTLGAFFIIAGIIIAKVSETMSHTDGDNTAFTIIGILMIALGALFISINIITRLIGRSTDN
jgi:LPXTG-motif cell wall-anchored protein